MKKNNLFFILIALVITTSACANMDSNTVVTSPTDQLIEGNIEVTTEWQTITFDKPLETAPHIQDLNLNFDPEYYDFAGIDGKADELDKVGSETIIRKKDNQLLFPKVIFISEDGLELPAGVISHSGYTYSNDKHRLSIGFGISSKHHPDQIYFQPDIKIKAIKIKANVPMTVESFHWLTARYSQFPNKTWDDVREGQILTNWK